MDISFPELPTSRPRAGRRLTLGLAAAAAVVLLTGASGTITENSSNAPITWEAGTFDLDYKSHLMHLHGDVKISRGDVSIAADEAQAVSLDSRNSHWVFTGKVHVRSESQGDLRGDRATVEITQGELANAVVTGSPAQFEQTRSTAGRLVKGHAATINYDVAAGNVKLNGDAWLSDDRNDNDMRSPSITYNVRDRRIEGDGDVTVGGRVHMKIQPRADPAASTTAPPGKP